MTWVGTHGGAGETSIAAATGVGLALTQRWPDPELGWPGAVMLVARSNAAGLTAAARMVQELLSGTVPDLTLHALVVVADAPGRLPKSLRTRVRELSGAVARVRTLEWIPAWREDPRSAHPAVNKLGTWAVDRVAADLRAGPANGPAEGPADGLADLAGRDRGPQGTLVRSHSGTAHAQPYPDTDSASIPMKETL